MGEFFRVLSKGVGPKYQRPSSRCASVHRAGSTRKKDREKFFALARDRTHASVREVCHRIHCATQPRLGTTLSNLAMDAVPCVHMCNGSPSREILQERKRQFFALARDRTYATSTWNFSLSPGYGTVPCGPSVDNGAKHDLGRRMG